MSKTGPLVVIDGHNLFIRNYCVSTMMTRDGERCGGTVGTLASVKKIINDLNPSNILLIWDGEGGSQRRKAIYGAYKEGRTIRMNKREDDMEEDPDRSLANMRKQRQDAADLLSLLGIPQVRADGVEADDLMAYVAGKMDHPGGCVIVTTDKDLLQLIREQGGWEGECDSPKGKLLGRHKSIDSGDDLEVEPEFPCNPCIWCGMQPYASQVQILSPVKKKMYDTKSFMEDHHGILPINYRLIKAITGDASDNIEGIKGLGEITIVKVFPQLTKDVVTPKGLIALAEETAKVEEGKKQLGIQKSAQKLLDGQARFWENLTLVDLSDPMLSATAARQARDAMRRDLGCRELEFRMRLNREGVNFNDEKLVGPFRDFVVRRRKFLRDTESQQQQVEQQLQGTENKDSE